MPQNIDPAVVESTDLFAASNLLQEMGETFAVKSLTASAHAHAKQAYGHIKSLHRESRETSNEAHQSDNRGEVEEHMHDLHHIHRSASHLLGNIAKTHPKHAHAKQLVAQIGYHKNDVKAHHGSLLGNHDEDYSATPGETFAADNIDHDKKPTPKTYHAWISEHHAASHRAVSALAGSAYPARDHHLNQLKLSHKLSSHYLKGIPAGRPLRKSAVKMVSTMAKHREIGHDHRTGLL